MKKAPKDKEFLALKDGRWNLVHWATKDEGLPKAMFIDRESFDMSDFTEWHDLPQPKESQSFN
jgi:hypothetical protein